MEDRKRRTVQQITGDMSLTEDLDDAEAMRLLDWGTDAARRLVMRTVEMDDHQANDYLDQHIPNLRRVIRRTNKLIGFLKDSTAEENVETLERIFDAADKVPVLHPRRPDDMHQLSNQLQLFSQDTAIMTVLSHFSLETPADDT